MMIYDEDCKTLSTNFKNSGDLMSSLSNGYMYALLNNGASLSSFKFCIKVTSFHTIMIQNLELVLLANGTMPVPTVIKPVPTVVKLVPTVTKPSCSNTLVKVQTSQILPFEQMYNATQDTKTLISPF
jgi:hypothetical protein